MQRKDLLREFNPRYDAVPVEKLYDTSGEELEEDDEILEEEIIEVESRPIPKTIRMPKQPVEEEEPPGISRKEISKEFYFIISNIRIERFSERLDVFFADPMVYKRIQESPIYMPTDWHVQQTFNEFRSFLLKNLGNVNANNIKEMEPFLSLAKQHDSITDDGKIPKKIPRK
jgi:hypothetical protein